MDNVTKIKFRKSKTISDINIGEIPTLPHQFLFTYNMHTYHLNPQGRYLYAGEGLSSRELNLGSLVLNLSASISVRAG